MPSRKQRRRQQKARRHEYEYVLVDEDGNEVEVDPAELRAVKPAAKAANGKSGSRRDAGRGRPAKVVPPPSWTRVSRRALIFAPLMFVFVSLLGRSGDKLTLSERVIQTVVLVALFVPFGYFTERIAYRAYLRRSGRAAEEKKTPS